MTRLSATVLLCALAACSSEKAPVPAASEAATPAASTGAAVTTNSIPEQIRGSWGMVPADCTSTKGDAKGLLVIDATTLKFYESLGKLGAIAEAGDTRIRASFAFTGEGMIWQREETLELQDGALIRREAGQDAAPGPFKYTRCQAK
ncbi:MAG: hypothetical protein EBR34_14085 [Sphingomonadaceae bacterium]|nr:hypothetical protein [Sphingomonadaceae bacterium]